MSNTEKGSRYEVAVQGVLKVLAQHFDIAEFDEGKPGYIYKNGKHGKLKVDVTARKSDGQTVIFSCKAWKTRPSASAVGDLLLASVNENAEGFLVSTMKPTDNTLGLAHGVGLRVLTIVLGEDSDFFKLTEFLRENIQEIHMGMAEAVVAHDELTTIERDLDGNVIER